MMKTALEKKNKNQIWLAEELGISNQTVSNYINGINLPKKEYQQRLFEALDLPYQSIDDLIEELEE